MTSNIDLSFDAAEAWFRGLQSEICDAVEALDGKGKFESDNWLREGGGGGLTRVLCDGNVFERAGVNFSRVYGSLDPAFSSELPGSGHNFEAAGVSLVFHPLNPNVPTVHMNVRMIGKGDAKWFGGGMDLTPYYPHREDAVHFHRTVKNACDEFDPDWYRRFKTWCDEYFYLPHRKETRGVGGLFFDYLGVPANEFGEGVRQRSPHLLEHAVELGTAQSFMRTIGSSFLSAYMPIAERRVGESYGDAERMHQLLRRGRYVEFNLLFDRGTQFGLRTDGRTESILMSMPPVVRWEYCTQAAPGSREAELADFLVAQDWL